MDTDLTKQYYCEHGKLLYIRMLPNRQVLFAVTGRPDIHTMFKTTLLALNNHKYYIPRTHLEPINIDW